VGISLQDAVGMALVKNPELAISASNVRIARYRVVQDKGNFDVQLHVEPSSNFSVTPPENLFFAGPGPSGMVILAVWSRRTLSVRNKRPRQHHPASVFVCVGG